MRLDKLTTKFQEALGDAQSLALGNAEFADGKVTMSPQSFALVEIDG